MQTFSLWQPSSCLSAVYACFPLTDFSQQLWKVVIGILTSQARKLSFREAMAFPEATLCRNTQAGFCLGFHTCPLERWKDHHVFQNSIRLPGFESWVCPFHYGALGRSPNFSILTSSKCNGATLSFIGIKRRIVFAFHKWEPRACAGLGLYLHSGGLQWTDKTLSPLKPTL